MASVDLRGEEVIKNTMVDMICAGESIVVLRLMISIYSAVKYSPVC